MSVEFFLKVSVIFLLITLLIQVLSSCTNYSSKKDTTNKDSYETYFERLEREKKEKLAVYSDSTVNLSFKGIALGSSFTKTLQAAKHKKDIYNVIIESDNNDGKSATCCAKLYLPNNSEGEEVDIKITSFQDTITSFIIISDKYETRNSIMNMYKTKYKEELSEEENDYDDWGNKKRRSCSESNIWTFKNQSIRLSFFTTEERENYVKDARMRSPENRYGVKYTTYFNKIVIIYSDLNQLEKIKKIEALERMELAKQREKERAIQANKDSIKRIENEKRMSQQDF